MATKTATKTVPAPATEEKTRNRRTADQIVADLEAEIERVKARAAAREARQTDDGKALLGAARALDQAIKQAEGDEAVRALEAARATVGERLIAIGVRPRAKKR